MPYLDSEHRREQILVLVRRNMDGVTRNEVEAESGMSSSWASKLLKAMTDEGVLERHYRSRKGVRGQEFLYFLKGRAPQASLLDEPVDDAVEKKRKYNREYYREYRAGKRGGSGNPRAVRKKALEQSHRLAEAAQILFPDGLRINEDFFAWVDWTRELMNG